jgi:hypothetical protein
MADQSAGNPGSTTPAQKKFDKAALEKDASWIAARLQEPSTWAGLGMLLGVAGVVLPPDLAHAVQVAGTALGGLLAVVLKEAA